KLPKTFLAETAAVSAVPMYHPAAIGPIRSCDIANGPVCGFCRARWLWEVCSKHRLEGTRPMKIDSSLAAVVTGGASGLGLATAKAFRAAGAKVAISDMNEKTGNTAAAETGAVFCQCDVTSDVSVDAAFAKARAANGQERALVCC